MTHKKVIEEYKYMASSVCGFRNVVEPTDTDYPKIIGFCEAEGKSCELSFNIKRESNENGKACYYVLVNIFTNKDELENVFLTKIMRDVFIHTKNILIHKLSADGITFKWRVDIDEEQEECCDENESDILA